MTNDRRPRIDAILRSIEEGKYDEELVLLSEAIANRVKFRKDEIMRLVNEVFGEGHKIVPEGKTVTQNMRNHLNVIRNDKPEWAPAVDTILEGADDVVVSAEKPEEVPLTGEWESRSPQFGSIDPEESA